VLSPRLGQFARQYPDIVLDVTTDDSPLDLVAGRFDAGIHLGEFIARDMVAVRVSRDHRAAIVGSAQYFESHPKPQSPRDLLKHRCINIRMGSAGVYRWEFDKGDQSLTVAVNGSLVTDEIEMTLRAAIDGVGLAFAIEEHVAPHLKSGALVRVLEDWCPPFAGFFLYYPSRRQQPAALSALIKALRV
jgi:DNA-binding transcriptional LysR family regulator